MDIEIKVPSLGESENEATLIGWLKSEGDTVQVDDVLAEIESDKITMEIVACEAGELKDVRCQVDDTVEPGQVIGLIDTSVDVAPTGAKTPVVKEKSVQAKVTPKPVAKQAKKVAETLAHSTSDSVNKAHGEDVNRIEERVPMSRIR
ncbi:MAG: biotin/lipoyl-containing protein, partial [Mariprofundaceae bacterium]